MAFRGGGDRPLADVRLVHLAAVDELDLQGPCARPFEVVEALLPASGGDDELLRGVPALVAHAPGDLQPAGALLVLGGLGHFVHPAVGAFALDELVDHLRGGVARTRHELGAHAVGVDRGSAEGGDRVLVEVARHRDLGGCGPQVVQLPADGEGLGDEIAGVQADGPELPAGGPRGGHRPFDTAGDVVGVHQQGGPRAHGRDLGGEGLLLAVVDEGEGVRGRPGDPQAVPAARLQVRRRLEARDHRGARAVDGRDLVGAAGPEFDAGAAVGGCGHPRGGRGHRRVVVEDREDDRLQDAGLGEGPQDGEDRRMREVAFALGVPVDVAGETVALHPLQRPLGDDSRGFEVGDLLRAEAEVPDGFDHAAGSGDDAVPPLPGQAPGEDLEDAAPARRARCDRRVDHRQLVHVRE